MSSWAAIHPERCECRKQRGIFDAGKLRKTCSKSSRPLRAAHGRRAIPALRTVGWYARSWAGKASRASVSPPETIVRRRNYSNTQTPESFGFFLYAQQNPPFFKTGFIVSTGVDKVVRSMRLELIRLPIRPSNVRVCQFRHDRGIRDFFEPQGIL